MALKKGQSSQGNLLCASGDELKIRFCDSIADDRPKEFEGTTKYKAGLLQIPPSEEVTHAYACPILV